MVEITIKFDPATGRIDLGGEIGPFVQALGVLDMAKELIHRQMRDKASKVITMAPVILGGRGAVR